MSHWKSFRYRLEHLGVRVIARLVRGLSRQRCVRLANVLGELAYRMDRRGRGVALENMRAVFRGRFDEAQCVEFARGSYRNFFRGMLDLFWTPNLTPENWHKTIEVEGFEPIREQLARERRGAILFCVHHGHWEWSSIACGFLGFKNVIVAENFKNPLLTEIFQAHRQHSGQTIIAQENSLLRMLKVVKRGGSTGMLVDLNLRPTQAATIIDAFGPEPLKMCVPVLHTVLVQRANALLVPVESLPLPDGRCRIIAYPPITTPDDASLQEIAQACWDFFEPLILARPGLWLWPYKHFRFRPRGAERPYPSYSNESSKFETLRRSLEPAVK